MAANYELWLLMMAAPWLHLDFPEVVHLVDAVEVILHASDHRTVAKVWPSWPGFVGAEMGTFDGHMFP